MILVPFGTPNLQEAVDRCLASGKGDLLTNAAVYHHNNSFFFGSMGYTVKGDVWVRSDPRCHSGP